jgi:hypothetical protein
MPHATCHSCHSCLMCWMSLGRMMDLWVTFDKRPFYHVVRCPLVKDHIPSFFSIKMSGIRYQTRMHPASLFCSLPAFSLCIIDTEATQVQVLQTIQFVYYRRTLPANNHANIHATYTITFTSSTLLC